MGIMSKLVVATLSLLFFSSCWNDSGPNSSYPGYSYLPSVSTSPTVAAARNDIYGGGVLDPEFLGSYNTIITNNYGFSGSYIKPYSGFCKQVYFYVQMINPRGTYVLRMSCNSDNQLYTVRHGRIGRVKSTIGSGAMVRSAYEWHDIGNNYIIISRDIRLKNTVSIIEEGPTSYGSTKTIFTFFKDSNGIARVEMAIYNFKDGRIAFGEGVRQ
jgi:hypothetical protein